MVKQMKIDNDIISKLSSKMEMRAILKSIEIEKIEKMIIKMQSILEEKLKANDKKTQKIMEKKVHIDKIIHIMNTEGIKINDLKRFHPKRGRTAKTA